MSADTHTLTGAYALDALSEAERVAFEDHLAQCEVCRAEVAELRETAALLGSAAATTPSPKVRSHVLASIRAVRQLPPDDGPIVPLRGRKWPLRVTSFAAAASIAGVAVLGVQALRTDAERTRTEETLAELRQDYANLADVLAAEDARVIAHDEGGSSASIVFSRNQGTLAFVPRQMPAPGPDETYQLWLITADGPHSAGLHAGTADPVTTELLPETRGFGITVEPAGGSQQPTSDPVMLIALPR